MAMSIAPCCNRPRFSCALPSAPPKKSLISTSPLVRFLISSAHHLSTCEPAWVSFHWLLALSSIWADALSAPKAATITPAISGSIHLVESLMFSSRVTGAHHPWRALDRMRGSSLARASKFFFETLPKGTHHT